MKKYLKLAGNILMIISLIYLSIMMYNIGIDIKNYLNKAVIVSSFWIVFYLFILLFLSPFNFKIILDLISGVNNNFIKVYSYYYKANLYKYIPSNVIQYLARNELALDGVLKHSDVAFASFLEIVCVSIASFLCAIVFSRHFVLLWIAENESLIPMIVVVIMSLLILGFIVSRLFKEQLSKFILLYKSLFKCKNLLRIIIVIFIYMVSLTLGAMLYVQVLGMFSVSISSEIYFQVLGLYIFAWIIGFATPGAPGGIGIREAVMIYFFSNIFSASVITLSACMYRLLSIASELLAFCLSMILIKKKKWGK